MILQNKNSVLETDILFGMIEKASSITGHGYGQDERVDFGLRVLADHGRSITFMIADGVRPSNEERGYVLRRVMRRAIRHARLIGHEGEILPGLVDRCVELMGDAYPEIVEYADVTKEIASREEERFTSTLKQGLSLLETRGREDEDVGADHPGRGRRVQAARHLRIPDRPHHGNRRRIGSRGGCRRLLGVDDRAARARTGGSRRGSRAIVERGRRRNRRSQGSHRVPRLRAPDDRIRDRRPRRRSVGSRGGRRGGRGRDRSRPHSVLRRRRRPGRRHGRAAFIGGRGARRRHPASSPGSDGAQGEGHGRRAAGGRHGAGPGRCPGSAWVRASPHRDAHPSLDAARPAR